MQNEIDKVGIKLKDGTVYIMEEADVIQVEITLEQDFDTAWTNDGAPITRTNFVTAHMHLHLISKEIGMHMQGPPLEEIDAKDLTMALGEGE